MGKVVLATAVGIILGGAWAWGAARWQWQQGQERNQSTSAARQAQVSPQPGQRLTQAPQAITITFPQAVDEFEVEIRRDDWEVILGPDDAVQISEDQLTVTQAFPATSAGVGTFTTTYSGCPRAASGAACFRGQFDFTVEGK